MTAPPPTGVPAADRSVDPLLGRSFIALLFVQFLGVVDDALLRVTVVSAAEVILPHRQHALAIVLPAFSFLLPWVLLSPVAGWLADRFSRQHVLTACKLVEAACVFLLVAALQTQSVTAMCGVLALFSCQLALCNPSKLGSIPDLVTVERIPAANAAIALAMVLALIVGNWYVGALFDYTFPDAEILSDRGTLGGANWDRMLILFGVVSAAGIVASLCIRRLPAADPQARLSWNLFDTLREDLRTLRHSREMLHVSLAYAFYWSFGTLAQLSALAYGTVVLKLSKTDSTPLIAMLAVGAGLGSIAAGVWSAGIIELGIVPVAGFIFSTAAIALSFTNHSMELTSAALFFVGFAGGLVNVPLYSYLQYRSPVEKRGSILAANNFLVFLGMIFATAAYYLLAAPDIFESRRLMSPRGVFLFAGVASLPMAFYGFKRIPAYTFRFLFATLFRCFYRIRAYGRHNLPEHSGALLVANHLSWIDGLLIGMTCPRSPRMIAYKQYVESRWTGWFSRMTGIIPIDPGSRQAVQAIREAREALRNGEYVCIFAEGCLSRTGHLLSFQPGMLKILKDTGAPVIPIYLDGLWGTIFSFSEGVFFWKRPKAWRSPLGVHYGPPLVGVDDARTVRTAVERLGQEAVAARKPQSMILTRRFLREARLSRRQSKVADSSGADLTGGTLLLRSLALRRMLAREVLQADEKYVGVLLPPSVGGVVVNAALALDRRVAVNLNYTVTSDVMNACIRQAGIRRVLTSRRVMEKFDFKIEAELVYLEDFKDRVSTSDKVVAALQTHVLPIWLVERSLGLTKVSPDDVLTVIFTSGSTGEPKGVMLSYDNVGSNVTAIDQVIHLKRSDVLVGILPFFHSFGYTVTIWTILTLSPKGIYHFSPLDAREIGKLCRKHKATILLATPTFLRNYLRRVDKEDFATLDVVVAGAEKLPSDLCDAFEKQFGVRPSEGYGCTELSPLVSVNVPASRAPAQDQPVAREGTVGRPIPGVAAKITDLDTGAELGLEQPGMLWIKGPNVMLGYMGHPEKTAHVVQDGWYQTGDVAVLDKDGFIKITGRESRFSKIGGEMVPHIKIEEALNRIVGSGEEEIKLVVTAVPDAKRGERLVVLHTAVEKRPDAIVKELQQAGLPNLWIPGADSFLEVEQIPVLGTGKLDLRGLKNVALARFAPTESPAKEV
jgi:acyl-[acyl-carrier-protein]-phospholipid O-acyltransferase/long-chain-fatty-acid--[acyl-carrier-protein] ligase